MDDCPRCWHEQVVYGEVVEHLKGQRDFVAHQAALHDLLLEIQPIFLDYSILDRYADVRRALRPPHGPGLIGDIDTLIAATALEHRLTVVTTDAHFLRVPDLEVMMVAVR
jgi:predicted nucleic acid-binding protein